MKDDSFLPSVFISEDNPLAAGVLIGSAAASKEMLFSSLLKPAPAASVSDNELLNYTEAAAYLKVQVSTLQGMVHFKKIPYLKVGSLVRFRKAELDTWLSSSSSSAAPNIPLKRKIKPRKGTKPKTKMKATSKGISVEEKYLIEYAKRKAENLPIEKTE